MMPNIQNFKGSAELSLYISQRPNEGPNERLSGNSLQRRSIKPIAFLGKSSLKTTIYRITAISAIALVATATYLGYKISRGEISQGTESAKHHLSTSIQTRTSGVLQRDIYKDMWADINEGEFGLQILGKEYCKDPQFVTVTSQEPFPDWLDRIYSPIGNLNTGFSEGIYIVNDTAYVTTSNTLNIVNVSNRAKPTLLGTYKRMIGEVFGVTVVDATAFVAGENELYVINISNKTKPTLSKRYALPKAYDVTILADVAFVTASNGLNLFNISNKANPTHLINYNTNLNDPKGLTVVGNTAFVTDRNGLQILNVANKANLTFIGRFSTPYAKDVAVVGNIAYVTALWNLEIIDISNKAKPASFGSFPSSAGKYGVVVKEDKAFMATQIGLHIIDIKNKASPFLLGNWPVFSNHVAVMDNTAFVAASGGLHIISFSEVLLKGTPNFVSKNTIKIDVLCANAVITDSFVLSSNKIPQKKVLFLNDLSTSAGKRVKISLKAASLFTSFSTPPYLSVRANLIDNQNLPPWLELKMKPRYISTLPLPFSPKFVAVSDGILYVGLYNKKLQAYEITTPYFLQDYSIPGGTMEGLSVAGDTAFIINANGLQIYQIDTDLKLLGRYNISDPKDISVVGNTAFVKMFTEIHVVNIMDKGKPTLLRKYTVGPSNGIAIADNTVFVLPNNNYSPYSNNLQIFRIYNETGLIPTGSFSLSRCTPSKISVYGDSAFIACVERITELGSIQIIDVANPKNPKIFGSIPLKTPAIGIAVSGYRIYVASENKDRSGSIAIYDQDNWELSGVPASTDAGNYQIVITAKALSGASTSEDFHLRVEGPPVPIAKFANQSIKTNIPFAYFIEKTDFKDPNDDPLTYSAALKYNWALPEWLSFNPSIPALIGTPKQSDVGLMQILIYAKDALHPPVFSTLNIIVSHDNRPPQVANKVASPAAKVGEAYNFIPSNAFFDPDGDKLKYSAALDDEGALPSWLVFSQEGNSPVFKGTPTPSDTGFFQAKRLAVTLKADDGKSIAFTTFPIIVSGESYPEKLIKIAGPALTALTFAWAAYEKRALFLNGCNTAKYRKPLQKASVGNSFSYSFTCHKKSIRKVVVYTLVEKECKRRMLSRLYCHNERQEWVPVPNDIPAWLNFDCNTGSIYSHSIGPKETDIGLVRIKALGNAGVILEQLDIAVEAPPPPLPPEASDSSFNAEETTINWLQVGRRPQGVFIPMTLQ